jgi:lysophospholipase L1-like esterase
MCVGDSITDGYGISGSYRKYLYQNLSANGYDVDMVGLYGSDVETYYDSSTQSSLQYDGNYSAVSGYAIQQMNSGEYRSGIYETLVEGKAMETCQPDVVLLQIGTNDVISNYNDGIIDRLENLVDYLVENMDDDGVVFVTTIPYMDATNSEVTSWFAHYDDYWNVSTEELAKEIDACVDSYNAQIKAMVERKLSEGCTNVQFADVNSVLDAKSDLRDGVHPTDEGYKEMGSYWSQVLTDYFSGVTSTTTPSEETSYTTTSASETEVEWVDTEDVTVTTTEDDTVRFPEDTIADGSTSATTEGSMTEGTTEYSESTDYTDSTDYTSEPEEGTTSESVTTEPTWEPQHLAGDVNFDGTVSGYDLLLLKMRLLGVQVAPEGTYAYDVNGDGRVDVVDAIVLKKALLGLH